MRRIVLLTVLVLVACSTTPHKGEPVRVTGEELDKFWTVAEGPAGISLDALSPEQRAVGGAGTVEYRIDRDGVVHDVRVLKSVPIAFWGEFARQVVSTTRYAPAPANPGRTPVVVIHRVSFGEKYHHSDNPAAN